MRNRAIIAVGQGAELTKGASRAIRAHLDEWKPEEVGCLCRLADLPTLELVRQTGASLALFCPYPHHHMMWRGTEIRLFRLALGGCKALTHASVFASPTSDPHNIKNALSWSTKRERDGRLLVLVGEDDKWIDGLITEALKWGLEVHQVKP